MKKITFFFFVLLLISCHSSDQKSAAENITKDDNNPYLIDIKKWYEECLPVSRIMINDTIPMMTMTSDLIKVLGKPEKILPVPPDFSNRPKNKYKEELLYFKDLRYKAVGDYAYLESVNFKNSNHRIVYQEITLDSNTTISDVRKKFPQALRLLHGGGNSSFSGFVELPAIQTQNNFTLWFLIFHGEKLVRLDWVAPFGS